MQLLNTLREMGQTVNNSKGKEIPSEGGIPNFSTTQGYQRRILPHSVVSPYKFYIATLPFTED